MPCHDPSRSCVGTLHHFIDPVGRTLGGLAELPHRLVGNLALGHVGGPGMPPP